MAYTLSHIVNMSVGNRIMKIIHVTADAAESNIDTGLSIIESFSVMGGHFGRGSLPLFLQNKDSSNTASNGKIGVSGLVSGDFVHIQVYGR